MQLTSRLDYLIANNTGYSSKNFILISMVVLFAFHLLMSWILIMLSFFMQKTIPISLTELTLLIGAIQGILGVFLGAKIWSEKYEAKQDTYSDEDYEEDKNVKIITEQSPIGYQYNNNETD